MRFVFCLLLCLTFAFSAKAEISETDKKILTPNEVKKKELFESDKDNKNHPYFSLREDLENFEGIENGKQQDWEYCKLGNEVSTKITHTQKKFRDVSIKGAPHHLQIDKYDCSFAAVNLSEKTYSVEPDDSNGWHRIVIKIDEQTPYLLNKNWWEGEGFFIKDDLIYITTHSCCPGDFYFSSYSLDDRRLVDDRVVYDLFVDDYLDDKGQLTEDSKKYRDKKLAGFVEPPMQGEYLPGSEKRENVKDVLSEKDLAYLREINIPNSSLRKLLGYDVAPISNANNLGGL